MIRKPFEFRVFVAAIVAALITLAIYLPSLKNSFVNWDDNTYVYDNARIRSLDMQFVTWAFTNFDALNWHPLTWLSHGLDYALWGLNPMGHHLTSIILHCFAVFLVVLLTIKLIEITGGNSTVRRSLSESGSLIAAVVAGLLFGIHPLHVESVAWVSERKDVLSAFFFILSLLFYLRYAKSGQINEKQGRFSVLLRKDYLLSLAFFLSGLLSKPMVITLPLILLILDWYPLKRLKGFKNISEKIPFFLLSAASIVVTIFAQRGALASYEGLPFTSRLLSATKSLILYLEKIFWPVDLIPFYPYPANIDIFSFEYFVPILLLIAMSSASLYLLKTKKQKLLLSVWGYYLITMLPVIGIVQVGKQELADRYMYLPSIGPFVLIGIAAGLLFEAFRKQNAMLRTLSLAIPLIFFLPLSYLTTKQIGIWKDSVALWDREIEILSEKPGRAYLFLVIPFHNRGTAFAERGEWDLAIQDFSTEAYLNPVDFLPYRLRGEMYANKKDFENALNDYTYAIYLNPNDADIYYRRASILAELQRYQEAVDDYTKAINQTTTPPPEYYYNRGKTFKKLGNVSEAEKDFLQANNIVRGLANK